MLKKTTALLALIVLAQTPAGAQPAGGGNNAHRCEAVGGRFLNGTCQMPKEQQLERRFGQQQGQGQPAGQPPVQKQQPNAQPQRRFGQQQEQGQPPAQPQQPGAPTQQRFFGQQQPGGQPQVQQQQGAQKERRFGQDERERGRGQPAVQPPEQQQPGPRQERQFGQEPEQRRGQRGAEPGQFFGQQPGRGFGREGGGQSGSVARRFENDRRDANRFQNDRRIFGQDFARPEFSARYYGRYGSDPREFERRRELFRVQQRWGAVYAHDYVFADDPFYSDCRYDPVIGNTIMGSILGGFLGNVVSGGRPDATISGMIFGGAAAASLSQDLNCEDRYFVYRAYFDAFNRGIPRTAYQWSNPRTRRYGTLIVGDYYMDIDGYYCATYSQDIFIRGRRLYTGGHACSQNDGTWVMID